MTKLHMLAAAAITLAAPAFAAEPKLADPTPSEMPAPGATSGSTARTVSPHQRYCVVETITGSHIPQRTCHTRAEWLSDGFDPLAAK